MVNRSSHYSTDYPIFSSNFNQMSVLVNAINGLCYIVVGK